MSKNNKKSDAALTKKEILKRLSETMPIGVSSAVGGSPALSNAIKKASNSNGFARKADGMNMSMGAGSPFVSRGPLMYVDPMFDPILFLFPKDRIDEINKRLRHYYECDPIVGGAIDMHTAFPLSDFYLECEDPENQKFWNDWKDRVGLLEILRCMVHDYWLLGESMVLPIWDPYNFEFSHFNQYPPENVDIISTYVTPKKAFMLKPDPKLMDKVNSPDAADQALVKLMDPEYVESLKGGAKFFLGSDDKVMYLARQPEKYRQRGVSLVSRALKDLLYKDKIRLLQMTFADRHMFPLKIFKVGSESRGWIPNRAHFQRLQGLLAQAQNDPDFNLIWHFGLSVDYVGTKDKIANLVPELEWVERQVMAALFVNEEIIHGGLPSAVRDTVNMRTLMHRYMDVREKVERMMITHIFLPMAKARGFYRKAGGKTLDSESNVFKIGNKEIRVKGSKNGNMFRVANSVSGTLDLSSYDIPRPVWKKVNLVNNAAEQQILLALEGDGKIPLETVLEMMGIDSRTNSKKLKQQEGTVADPLFRRVREEIGTAEGIREQVLSGKKSDEWLSVEVPEEGAPGSSAGGPPKPGKKSLPPMGGGGGAPSGEKPKMPKPPSDMGGGSMPPSPPPVSTPSPAPVPGAMSGMGEVSPMPTAPGGESAPGMSKGVV